MKAASKLIALTSLGLAMLLGGGCANLKEITKMDSIYQFTAKGRNGNIVKRFHPTTPPETIDAEIAKLLK